jgi:UDP-N-acetylmuramoylalanine-D-glutamate ligase
MTVQPNGTVAKDIALHFVNATNQRVTPHIMRKTIQQAKSLLSSGYKKDEIISVIDFLIKHKSANMYSLGYVNASINDILREMKEMEEKERLEQVRKEIAEQQSVQRSEVVNHAESTERNREKAKRIGTGLQSRLGKKFDFHMFEGK